MRKTTNQLSGQTINQALLPKPLLITTGDPTGIGMDIVLQWAQSKTMQLSPAHQSPPIIATACYQSLRARAKLLQKNGVPLALDIVLVEADRLDDLPGGLPSHPSSYLKNAPSPLYILDTPTTVPVIAGAPNAAHASMVAAQLTMAHDLAASHQVAAIVTAPISKTVMIEGGIAIDGTTADNTNGLPFLGHTEFFMHKAGVQKVVMLLANDAMKVALVTTHLPLKNVAAAITADNVRQTVHIVQADLMAKFGLKNPRLLVCGLNPHAGENGHLGTEEREIINPVLADLQQQGVNVSLAMPADTLFTPHHLAHADVVIAMYHDQGLAPLKSHGFGKTANVTLGLPYIRTSVDHGTAFDLAGTGRADWGSLAYAAALALQMASR